MKLAVCIITLFAITCAVARAELPVQTNNEAQILEEKFHKSLKTNLGLVRDYSWDSRKDVTKGGKVMDIMIEKNWYGPDGTLQRKIINDQEAKLPTSFLIHRIAENMKEKMIDFMNKLHVFLMQYSLSDRQKVHDFFSHAVIGPRDAEGQIPVSVENVIAKGDRVTMWIDSQNYSITRTLITTSFDGNQIEFTATYKYIHPGLNYLAFAEIVVPVKKTVVLLHCYDYMKIH